MIQAIVNAFIAPWKLACVTSPAENPRLPNSDSGSSDEPSRRSLARSTSTKTTASATPAPATSQSQAGQPSARPSTTGYSIPSSAPDSSTTPRMSRRSGLGDFVLGTKRAASAKIAMPTGTFSRKMLRHPSPAMSALTSQPPSTGPMTAARPLTPPMMPYIGARSFGV